MRVQRCNLLHFLFYFLLSVVLATALIVLDDIVTILKRVKYTQNVSSVAGCVRSDVEIGRQ